MDRTIKISDETYQKIKKMCKQQRRTIKAIVDLALEKFREN